MQTKTLVHQQHPPTPPTVNNELQFGLHQVAQYITDRTYSYDEPRHSSAYGSPAPVALEALNHHSQLFQSSNAEGADFGLGTQYDAYGHSGAYYSEVQYNGIANNQAMYSGSPLSPRSTTDNDEVARHKGSVRPIAGSSPSHSDAKPRPKAIPKLKKGKAGKSEKPKTPRLTAPLSILTNEFTFVPVRNMEEWVNRSAETRKKEVEKRNGYVTRPMNSFMLYRSAYAERTKQWCLQNNHQIVSSVSGESWPLEPPEIRELYNEYAKIERINHQNAHPTYKFSPSKTVVPPRKRKGEFSDDEDGSEIGDSAWTPGLGGGTKIRHSRRLDRGPDKSLDYATQNLYLDPYDHRCEPNGSEIDKSTWEMMDGGRSMPMPMTHGDLYNQYFQTGIHPNTGMEVMEDLRIKRFDTPESLIQFSPGHSLLGLPGGNTADLMQQLHSHNGTPLDEHQVDPMLLAFHGGHHQDIDRGMVQHPAFSNGHMDMMDRELDHGSVHSLLGQQSSDDEFHSGTWHQDPNMGPMEQGSEFEKWMDDGHGM